MYVDTIYSKLASRTTKIHRKVRIEGKNMIVFIIFKSLGQSNKGDRNISIGAFVMDKISSVPECPTYKPRKKK